MLRLLQAGPGWRPFRLVKEISGPFLESPQNFHMSQFPLYLKKGEGLSVSQSAFSYLEKTC